MTLIVILKIRNYVISAIDSINMDSTGAIIENPMPKYLMTGNHFFSVAGLIGSTSGQYSSVLDIIKNSINDQMSHKKIIEVLSPMLSHTMETQANDLLPGFLKANLDDNTESALLNVFVHSKSEDVVLVSCITIKSDFKIRIDDYNKKNNELMVIHNYPEIFNDTDTYQSMKNYIRTEVQTLQNNLGLFLQTNKKLGPSITYIKKIYDIYNNYPNRNLYWQMPVNFCVLPYMKQVYKFTDNFTRLN